MTTPPSTAPLARRARASYDRTRFRPGVLCPHGHTWQGLRCSLRFRTTNACRDCLWAVTKGQYPTAQATPEEQRARAALLWLYGRGGEASVRDLCRYKVAGAVTRRDAEALASLLVAHGHGVIIASMPPTGGHTKRVFRMHTERSTLDVSSTRHST